MRYKEIKVLLEKLAQGDQIDLKAIKKLIINYISSETNENILTKLLKYVESAGSDEKLNRGILNDQDAKGLPNLVADVMNVAGTQKEKQHFANMFAKGFINLQKILTPGQKISIADIFQNEMTPDPATKETKTFVHRVFERLCGPDYRPGDSGPGEVALAIMSKNIIRTGGTKGTVSDIVVSANDQDFYIEVKGRFAGTPGRLRDEKVNTHNKDAIQKVFKKYGFEGQNVAMKSTNNYMGIRDVIQKLAQERKADQFAKELASGFFYSRGQKYRTKMAQFIRAGDADGALSYYTKALYDGYMTAKSSKDKKLSGFMFVNLMQQTFIYSTKFQQLQGSYVLSQIALNGPAADDRQFSPAVIIK